MFEMETYFGLRADAYVSFQQLASSVRETSRERTHPAISDSFLFLFCIPTCCNSQSLPRDRHHHHRCHRNLTSLVVSLLYSSKSLVACRELYFD
jgi:hypothetical protein